ncbi:DUF4124 domain-containing protein [Teredinibacter franksiae]|jgi:hypothetical protein|uniref:DUF4124 domain-containing protein n=1 Tax=Teredinibacter franksiae TaxID=2761453 RepID=UPI001624845D|nr:DUF4124 domain-containing protein [Teredinibacter franksiae]
MKQATFAASLLTTAMKLRKLSFAVMISAGVFSTASFAEDYYRWKGPDGVVHYGSHPPTGVEAIKIKTYGGKSTPPETYGGQSNAQADEQTPAEEEVDLPPEEVERRRKVAVKQKQMCEDERKRLGTLNRPGRIRMKQPDGSVRYMTQEEVQQEIATTQKVISDSCK